MLKLALLLVLAVLRLHSLQAADSFITDVHLDVQLDCKPDDPSCDFCKLCQNNALCQKLNGTSVCYCVPGFTGTRCQININECLSQPCRNNATCIDGINAYRCQCPAHYQGAHCETQLTACDLSPCKNGAKCLIDAPTRPLEYRCICAPGYTGHDCATEINECISAPCQNGARCEDLHLSYRCLCTTGFNGTNCQVNINDCVDAICQNGAKCVDLVNAFKCECAPGFTGLRCETRLSACEQPVSPCLNNGKCHVTTSSTLGREYICQCAKGYTGLNCESEIDECESRPCQNGGLCVDLLDAYRCECVPGYRGINCEHNINECAEVVGICPNNTRCIDLEPSANPLRLGYKCDCSLLNSLTGMRYVGQNCSSLLDICENEFVRAKCKNNAICEPVWIEDKAEQDFKCKCQNGYAGKYCDYLTIIKLDSSYFLDYEVNSGAASPFAISTDSILSEYNLKFEFKLSAHHFEKGRIGTKLPLVTLFLSNGVVIDLVVRNYIIEISKYEPVRTSSFSSSFSSNASSGLVTKSSLPFLNFNMSSHATKWHSIEIYIKFNLIQIVYFYENYYFDTIIQIKQMPPVLKKNTKIFNSFKIGKPFKVDSNDIEGANERFLEACIRNLKLNDNFLFLNDQDVKYGCDAMANANACAKDTCGNNAKCTMSLFDYTCTCAASFYGKNCEFKAEDMKFRANRSRILLAFDEPKREFSLNFSFSIQASAAVNSDKTFVDFVQLHAGDEVLTIGLQELNQSSRLFFKYLSSGSGANGTLFKIEELNKESFSLNQFYAIELSVRNGSLFFNLGEKTQIKLNYVPFGAVFDKVVISPSRQFVGLISGLFYINGKIVNPMRNESYSGLKISYDCLYDECEDECSEYASPKCHSNDQSKAQTNLIHEFTLHRSNPLKSISFDIDLSQFDKNASQSSQLLLSLIVNNNYRLANVLYKLSGSNKYLVFNNKSINLAKDPPKSTKWDRVKIQIKSTTIDFKINNMLYYATSLPSQPFLIASGLNSTDFESYSLNIGNQCLFNLRVNEREFPEPLSGSTSIFGAYSLINNNCKDKTAEISPQKAATDDFKYLCNQMKICDDLNAHLNSTGLKSVCLNELIYDINAFSDYQFNYAYQCGCEERESGRILTEKQCMSAKQELANNICSSPYICLNNGLCEPDDAADFKCKCEKYFTGKRCELFDPCLDNQCSVNSKCIALNQTYSCECEEGFVGKYCQISVNDTCMNERLCNANGKCINRYDAENHLVAYDCVCFDGFIGNNCENRLDKCVYQRPCKNGATCVSTPDGYRCECASGWRGVNCDEDVDECASVESNKCQAGSKCVNTIASYKCECDSMSFGAHCQFEHRCKAANPCVKGKCKVLGALSDDLHECQCDFGYKGDDCSMETCELMPCANNGSCVDANGTRRFECICDGMRWSGERCEHNVTTTTATTKTTTTSTVKSVFTSEQTDVNATELFKFQLDLQEQKQFREFGMKKPRKEYMYHFVLWPLLGLMIGLLLILLVTFLSKVKKSRATRGTYSPSRHEQHTSRLEFNLDLKRPPEERLI